MDVNEGEFESFIVIEDVKNKKTSPKKKIQNINLNKKNQKNIINKNDILIYDENTKKSKIISDYIPKDEIDNSFIKKNDFCIYSQINSLKEETENILKFNNDDFNNTFSSKHFKIEEDMNKQIQIQRSDSFNYESRTSTILFVNKIQKKNNKNKNVGDFINLIDSKENPDPLKAECILYDKKYNSFNGILNVDKKFKCSFELDKKSHKILNYNDEYYIFSILEIKNYNPNFNYLGKDTCVEINLKDNRYFLFKFNNNFKQFITILNTFAEPEQNISFFKNAFYRFNHLGKKFDINGWEIYNFDKEFKRQNVDFKYTYDIIDNSNFSFCSSYPEKIIVPNMAKKDLEKCAIFRSKKRIPTLTYRHKNEFCIWRSSQTKSGFMGKNEKDVVFLTKIAERAKKLIVYDARPKLNAMANKFKGAGYENTNNYPNINMEVIFCGIPNIHAVRSSFEKMFSTISYNNINEYSVIVNLPNTLWYETIILIIKSGFQIYNSINDKCTVLIHCSDGWDRTAQLSSISQLLLDKYYRTLEGFIVLIEKDWLSFGHQFRYRNGFYSLTDPESLTENQFSPIFIQWLDSVYQLMSQNYTKFEFNFNLLCFIAKECFTGKFGTFLFNNEKERKNNNAKTNTISIWSIVMKQKKHYLNPIYDPNNNEPLSINYKKIKLWTDYFYRFEKGEKEEIYLNLFNKKINEYEKTIENKQKIIEEMVRLIKKQSIDLSILSNECKKEMEKYNEQSDIKMSFVVIEPSKSALNIEK